MALASYRLKVTGSLANRVFYQHLLKREGEAKELRLPSATQKSLVELDMSVGFLTPALDHPSLQPEFRGQVDNKCYRHYTKCF